MMHAGEATRRVTPISIRARDAGGAMVETARRSSETAPIAPEALELAFAPLHKRAFGTAVGLAFGLLMFGATVMAVLRATQAPFPLDRLNEYFYGYTMSWQGAFIAFGWAFLVGFVGGWFFAFIRNLALALSLFAIRTRAQLTATRDFLDHI
jgi:hypothetical protein